VPERTVAMSCKTTPFYVVCSPCRCVGKTLIARLLTEFYLVNDRPVAAFDLADEGPQLADYFPGFTTIADIGDIRGQMALFDRVIAEKDIPTVIDVSYRAFNNFFTVVGRINFFEEARHRCIEPLIFFIIDPNATKAYAMLRHHFTQTSLLPVRNQIKASAIVPCAVLQKAGMLPSSLDIPLLDLSLRALINQRSFSFSQFWQRVPAGVPKRVDDQLRSWLEYIFSQLQHLEFSLGQEHPSTPLTVQGPARRHPSHHQRPIDAPEQVPKYASRRERPIYDLMDQYATAIVAMVQEAAELSNDTWARTAITANELSCQLRATEDRINQLQAEIEQFRNRAVRAEAWLQRFQSEIKQKLTGPRAPTRFKSTI
jgi:hypothetical protein